MKLFFKNLELKNIIQWKNLSQNPKKKLKKPFLMNEIEELFVC